MFAWCFQPNYCYICFQYAIGQWKFIFRSQKGFKLIYLWASIAIQIWLDIYFYQQKSTCGVLFASCFKSVTAYNIPEYWILVLKDANDMGTRSLSHIVHTSSILLDWCMDGQWWSFCSVHRSSYFLIALFTTFWLTNSNKTFDY